MELKACIRDEFSTFLSLEESLIDGCLDLEGFKWMSKFPIYKVAFLYLCSDVNSYVLTVCFWPKVLLVDL